MQKQKKHKYSSLITSMVIVILLNCGCLLFTHYIFDFVLSMIWQVSHNIVSVDAFALIGNTVMQAVSFIVPLKVFAYMRKNAFKEKLMPREKNILEKSQVLPVFLLGLGSIVVANYVNQIFSVFAREFLAPATFDYAGLAWDYATFVGLGWVHEVFIYLFFASVIPAVLEELLFRKAFCDALAPYGPKTAIIVTSVLFAMTHGNIDKFIYTFVAGIFLGWIYVGTKNIKLSMALHFVSNLLPAVGVVIYNKVSIDAYLVYTTLYTLVLCVLAIIFTVRLCKEKNAAQARLIREARENGTLEEYTQNRKKYINHIEMLLDENGEEVTSLSKQDKISGFFTPMSIAFIICVVLQTMYMLL